MTEQQIPRLVRIQQREVDRLSAVLAKRRKKVDDASDRSSWDLDRAKARVASMERTLANARARLAETKGR